MGTAMPRYDGRMIRLTHSLDHLRHEGFLVWGINRSGVMRKASTVRDRTPHQSPGEIPAPPKVGAHRQGYRTNKAPMSRDHRDKQGGHTNQFYVRFKPGVVKAMRRAGHKHARQRAKRDLNQHVEPAPIYPQETTYFD